MAMSVAAPGGFVPRTVDAVRRRPRYGLIGFGAVLALMAAVLPPALSVAVLAGIGLAALILARPVLAVYLLVLAVPYESIKDINAGGLNATITEFVALFGGAAFLMRTAIEGRVEVPWAKWTWPLLIFGGAMILSMTQATDFVLSIKEFLKLGEMLITYLLVLKYIDTPARLRRLLLWVTIVVASQALLGIGQTFLHAGPSSFFRGGTLRASGTFDQPNPFAGYLNLTLPLLIAGVMTGVSIAGKLTKPALLIIAVGVVLSVSRGALLATITAVVVMVLVYVPRLRPLLILGMIALFVLAAGATFGVVPSGVTDQFLAAVGLNNIDVANPTPVTWAAAERLAHVLAGVYMFLAHPILGVGIGNYSAVYPKFQVAPVWVNPLGHAHNYYVNIAAEAGIVGLIAFLILLVSAIVLLTRFYRQAQTLEARTIVLGAIGVLTTVIVHSNFDNIFVHAMESQFALVIGMATVACRLMTGHEREKRETGGTTAHG